MIHNFDQLIARAEQLMARIELALPQALSAPDWSQAVAWRYRRRAGGHGRLEPVRQMTTISRKA